MKNEKMTYSILSSDPSKKGPGRIIESIIEITTSKDLRTARIQKGFDFTLWDISGRKPNDETMVEIFGRFSTPNPIKGSHAVDFENLLLECFGEESIELIRKVRLDLATRGHEMKDENFATQNYNLLFDKHFETVPEWHIECHHAIHCIIDKIYNGMIS